MIKRSLSRRRHTRRRQVRADQELGLFPHSRITLDLGMGVCEHTAVSKIVNTVIGTRLVLKPKITDDLGPRWVSSADLGLSVNPPVGLIEISRAQDIRRNDGVVL